MGGGGEAPGPTAPFATVRPPPSDPPSLNWVSVQLARWRRALASPESDSHLQVQTWWETNTGSIFPWWEPLGQKEFQFVHPGSGYSLFPIPTSQQPTG